MIFKYCRGRANFCGLRLGILRLFEMSGSEADEVYGGLRAAPFLQSRGG